MSAECHRTMTRRVRTSFRARPDRCSVNHPVIQTTPSCRCQRSTGSAKGWRSVVRRRTATSRPLTWVPSNDGLSYFGASIVFGVYRGIGIIWAWICRTTRTSAFASTSRKRNSCESPARGLRVLAWLSHSVIIYVMGTRLSRSERPCHLRSEAVSP